jgi:hypothetical protein
LLAQDMGTQPVVTLPTPAPPTAAPAPTLPTPAAPTVRAMTPAPAPVIVPEASAETRAAPVARTRAATTTRRAQTVTRSAAPAAPAVAQAEPLAPAPVVPLAETPVIEPAPVMAEAVPAPVEPVAAESGGEVLPIVGGAAGLLLLAGGAYALSRRRRNAGAEDYTAETWEQDHVTYAEPAFAEPAVAAEPAWREPLPVAAPAMAAALPAGMDLSRYGRHVQAAYAGPTPDNPSLSLKRRLKRAAFFDQRERMAREAGEPSDMLQPISSAQATQATAPRADQLVSSRRVSPKAGTQALFGFRPAFQN